MRIIAGKYRGRVLKSPPSLRTRPTSDRLRETLFNIIAPKIAGARFLDLCAGSGAVGIEALSRGAAYVAFVDQSREMCALIGENVEAFKFSKDDIAINCKEASEWLRGYDGHVFDVIFFDPPYKADYVSVLKYLSEQADRLLSEGGIVIVEHYKKNGLPTEFGELKQYRKLKQGDSCLSFYHLAG